MKKRRMKKKPIIIAILLLLVIIGASVYFIFFNKEETEVTEVKNVDTIEGYGYTLSENATEYYKSLFQELKDVLSEDDVDEEAYAELVVKLFLADFFNLDNKISNSDVGGLQFVYEDFREDFTSLASTSMYKHVESNVYGDRDQDLPIVSSVLAEKQDNQSFTYGDNVDENAYVYNFTITYEEDMGYQEEGTITLIHSNDKLEVAAME